MIGKVFLTGKSFGDTCQYLCEDQSRSQVLTAEGVRIHDLKIMAEDFELQHRLMPDKEKAVFHAVLSFGHGEHPDDARLVELGTRYLEKVGVTNTQYVMVKHTDKEHLHMHIIANKVDNDGDPTGRGLIIERSIKAAQELTEEYGLKQHIGKDLSETHREALHEPDSKRYRIYEAIRDELPVCQRLEDLEKRLMEHGITMRYRYDQETRERQGVSFRLENRSFKGSIVDEQFALPRLEETLKLQRELVETERERQVQEQRLQQEHSQRQEEDHVHRPRLRLGM